MCGLPVIPSSTNYAPTWTLPRTRAGSGSRRGNGPWGCAPGGGAGGEASGGMPAPLPAPGTAPPELALPGAPAVIVYRTSSLTYRIGRRLSSVSCIGLPNIVAGRKFLPELIQDECRPETMADEIE